MSFTDRYIRVPISLVESKENDLPVQEEGIAAIGMINPFDISCYCEAVDDTVKERPLSKTMIYFRSGESMYIDLYLWEFEQLLNSIKHA